MKSRLEEVEELLKENYELLNGGYSLESDTNLEFLIAKRVKLEIEKDRLTRT